METTTHTPATTTTRLERPIQGRVLAGVAAGIAQRSNISVAAIRLGFIVAAFFGGFGILLYLAAWALMPEEGDPDSPAERWMANLQNPDRRIGAILIGIAAGIIVVSLAPITAVAIVALIVGAALLSTERRDTAPTETAPLDATDDTPDDETT